MAFGLAVPRFRVSNLMRWHTCLEQPPPPHLRVAFLLSRTFFGKPLGRIGVLKMLVFRPNKLGNKSVRIFARPLQAAGLDSLTPVAALIEPALDSSVSSVSLALVAELDSGSKIRRLAGPKLPLVPASRFLNLQV